MDADRRTPTRRLPTAAAAILVLALAPAAVRAQSPLGGTLTWQWQQVEEHAKLLQPDGTLRDTTFLRSFWSQYYELRHSAVVAHQLRIGSQVTYLDQSWTDREHARRVAGGTIQLSHPIFGITATYRPTLLTTEPVSLGVPGSPVFRTFKTRIAETMLAGNLAAPGLPRLDLSWARQHHQSDASATQDATVARNARLSYEAGPLDMHAGYGDQSRDLGSGGGLVLERWNGTAGAGLRLNPTPALGFGVNYDYSNYRTGAAAPGGLRTLAHSGAVNGTLRMSDHAGWALSYAYRRTQLLNHEETLLQNHDGSLLFNYTPSRVASVNVAGGVHTVNSSAQPVTERFVSAVATASGRVRTAWTGSATASHSTSWDVSGRPISTETMRAGSAFRGSRDFLLGVDLSTSLSPNATIGTGRVLTEAAFSVAASPLRSVKLNGASRISRAGPGFLHPVAASGNRSLELRWIPGRRLDFSAAIDRSQFGGTGQPGTRTRRAGLNLQPGARTRLSATYSRSDQAVQQSGTSQLVGREIYTAEISLGLGRGWTLRGNAYQVDPHGRNAAREYDAGVTKTFGR
jgi:hypothetical protein